MLKALFQLNFRIYRFWTAAVFWFGRRVTKAGWLVGFGAFIAAGLGTDTRASVAHQSFAFLACLILVAAGAVLLNRPRFTATRFLPQFASAGEKLSYRVLLHNQTRRAQRGLRLAEEMPDPRPGFHEFLHTPEPGEEQRNWYDRVNAWYRWKWLIGRNELARPVEREVPVCPPKGTTEVRMELTPLRRGVLRLKKLVVLVPDPFGLFCGVRKIAATQSILVLPKRYFVPPLALPGTMKYQQGGVALASAVGQSEEFVSLRDYRPGDPLRHIHWRSWARAGRPVVKEFQDEFFVRHALVLDTFGGVAHSDVFEEAVSVAASFACTVQDQDSLLDLMFVGPQAYCFTTGRGLAHTEQMLEILASVQVCRDQGFEILNSLVLEHAAEVSGCICVFIAWDEERRQLVERLKCLGIPLLVLVVVAPGTVVEGAEGCHLVEVGKVSEELAGLASNSG
jgi:uncharacterized protein (DUF58 family)